MTILNGTIINWERKSESKQTWSAEGQGRTYYISKPKGHSYGLYVVVGGATTSFGSYKTWRGAADRAEREEIGFRKAAAQRAAKQGVM